MSRMQITSILLIDDDIDEFEMVSEAIHKINADVEVYFLDNLEECSKYKSQHFDMVLLDINMPLHDGFSWLQKIREKNKELAVIMYSNSSSPTHISKAYQEGATLYFTKPESFSSLIQAIKKLLDLDWSNPSKIRSNYIQSGRFLTFQEV